MNSVPDQTPLYDPWKTGGVPWLNVAATRDATRALGPGTRAAVWVQGCPFRCAGCISPEWIPFHAARMVEPRTLAELLLRRPDVEGLTISGGEPMLQAAGLAEMVKAARSLRQSQARELDVVCFSGFTLETLRTAPPGQGVAEFLSEVDVLIDGTYINSLNDGRGLRGSSNQTAHYLTERLKGVFDFQEGPRHAEVYLRRDTAFVIGVPPTGLLDAFLQTVFTQPNHPNDAPMGQAEQP